MSSYGPKHRSGAYPRDGKPRIQSFDRATDTASERNSDEPSNSFLVGFAQSNPDHHSVRYTLEMLDIDRDELGSSERAGEPKE